MRTFTFKTLLFLVIFTFGSLFSSNALICAAQAPSPVLAAETAILMDQRSGQILYAQNADKQMYPASTTKILTALLAVEQGDLDETVTVGTEVLQISWDSSKAGLAVGDTISLRELIYALILPSGNDAAYTIAVHLGRRHMDNSQLSSTEAVTVFTQMMNMRAQELGAMNTNFIVPDGYHRADHYTTAKDLALIARAAMEHPLIQKVAATGRYVPETWIGPHVRPWGNTNKLVRPYEFQYEHATGLKTGYTGEAGFCMVGSAAKEDVALIAVVMNTSKDGRWLDSTALLEYGFNNYVWKQLVETDQVIKTVSISGQDIRQPESVDLSAAQGYGGIFALEDIPRIKREVNIFQESTEGQGILGVIGISAAASIPTISAPLNKGQVLGEIAFFLDGQEVFKTDLLATANILAMPWWRKVLVPGLLSLSLGLGIILVIKLHRRRRRRRSIFRGETRRLSF